MSDSDEPEVEPDCDDEEPQEEEPVEEEPVEDDDGGDDDGGDDDGGDDEPVEEPNEDDGGDDDNDNDGGDDDGGDDEPQEEAPDDGDGDGDDGGDDGGDDEPDEKEESGGGSCKEWLKKNEVYDNDFESILTSSEFNVNNPEEDFKGFTQKQWNELYRRATVERFKELKDQNSRSRLQKKLDRLERLWRDISGVEKTVGTASSGKVDAPSRSQEQSEKLLEQGGELKKYMQKESVWEKDLFEELVILGVTCEDDISKVDSQEAFDEVIRKVKVARVSDLKDQTSRNRLEKKLTAFEKIWRSKTGIKKTMGTASSGKKDAPQKSKERSENAIKNAPALKKYMQKENVWEKDLFEELADLGVTCEDDIGTHVNSQEAFDEVIRKVKVSRFQELKDQTSRNRLEKKLTAFEKIWRKKTGIKKTVGTASSGKKSKPVRSKEKSENARKNAPALKKYLQKENVWEKDLFEELADMGVTCEDDIAKKVNTQEKFDEVIRKVKVLRFSELKDQTSRNRLEKKLTAFEKLWRKKTGIKKTLQTKKTKTKTKKKSNKTKEISKMANEGKELKEYLRKNQIWEKELFDELLKLDVKCEEDFKKVNQETFDELVRKVRVQRFTELKDQPSRNRLDKKLIKFEKCWRSVTGIKKRMGGKKKKKPSKKKKKN